jgi:hypothetical protein
VGRRTTKQGHRPFEATIRRWPARACAGPDREPRPPDAAPEPTGDRYPALPESSSTGRPRVRDRAMTARLLRRRHDYERPRRLPWEAVVLCARQDSKLGPGGW